MDFDFSDDEQQLREAAARWVQRGYDAARRHAIVRGGGFSPDAWAELAGLGLLALGTAEADGGLGLGPVAAMVAMEELGRGLVLEPVAAVALVAARLLADAPVTLKAAWAPALAEGRARVVLAHQERAARYRLQHVDTRASHAPDGHWQLRGAKSLVPIGDLADAFVVPARVGGAVDDPEGIALFLVRAGAAGVSTRGYALQDGSRAAELSLHDVRAELLAPAGEAWPLLLLAVDIGIAALCAEGVGAMETMLALTVEHLNTRRQFGTTIGSFQALRHKAADMKMALELARSMSYLATLRLDAPTALRRQAVSQARVQLGQSLRLVGQTGVQLHGGIGITDEYFGSHVFKRLTAMELQFGDTLHHLGEVSARMQETAGVFA